MAVHNDPSGGLPVNCQWIAHLNAIESSFMYTTLQRPYYYMHRFLFCICLANSEKQGMIPNAPYHLSYIPDILIQRSSPVTLSYGHHPHQHGLGLSTFVVRGCQGKLITLRQTIPPIFSISRTQPPSKHPH